MNDERTSRDQALPLTARPVQVTVSCATHEEASSIIKEAVQRRLAAAGHFWPINSTYWWGGQIEHSDEFVVLLKSVDNRVDEIMDLIASLHSYEVPSIFVSAVHRLGLGVSQWLNNQTVSTFGDYNGEDNPQVVD